MVNLSKKKIREMAEGKGRCKQSNNMGELGKGERDQLLHKDEKKNALEYTQYRLEKQEKMYKCLH
jgi:hypothetical protein